MGKEIEKLENLEGLINKAKELNAEKIPWHWHYFPEQCDLNYTGGYVAVISTENRTYVAHSDIKPERETLRKINELYLNRP